MYHYFCNKKPAIGKTIRSDCKANSKITEPCIANYSPDCEYHELCRIIYLFVIVRKKKCMCVPLGGWG